MEEYILCSAINYKGQIITGRGCAQAIQTILFFEPKPDVKEINKLVVDETTGVVSITKNTTLDNIPSLNSAELKTVQHQARLQGWVLSESQDEHSSTTYKLTV